MNIKLLTALKNELKALMDKFIIIGYKLDFDIDEDLSDESFAWISWATIDLTIADKIINGELNVPYVKYEKLICDLQREIRLFNEFIKEIEKEYVYSKLQDEEYDYAEEEFEKTNCYDKDDYCREYFANKEINNNDSYDYVKSINNKKHTNNFWCY
jgi:hypothetical protein